MHRLFGMHSHCAVMAVSIDWESGADDIQEKMAEYALAVLKGKRSKSLFINFAVRIAQECDCWPKDFPLIARDIGIFISTDPVAVDKATFDLSIRYAVRTYLPRLIRTGMNEAIKACRKDRSRQYGSMSS